MVVASIYSEIQLYALTACAVCVLFFAVASGNGLQQVSTRVSTTVDVYGIGEITAYISGDFYGCAYALLLRSVIFTGFKGRVMQQVVSARAFFLVKSCY